MSQTVFNSLLAEIADPSCKGCKDLLDFDFTFAFQPIVDVEQQTIFAYEALVRGPNKEGAAEILSKVNDNNRYRFDW
jgi:EAL domain-containing protein (putative c-di-GMP-specific phosphodiesterase class I)